MKKINFIQSETGSDIEIEIGSSLIIVGANGSGKSRFGSNLEQRNQNSKRISAQRRLQFEEVIQKQDFESADSNLKSNFKNQSVIQPQDDFHQVLITLFAEEGRRDSDYVASAKESGPVKPELLASKKEQVLEVWDFIFPSRKLKLEKDRVKGVGEIGDFSGSELSDGERVGLYLISQVLLAPRNYFLIIDEPELHLHKSLMTRLWNKLEGIRSDCTFIYITHDLDFAVSKSTSKTIWIESYKNSVWKWSEIVSAEYIPDNLLLEILGSRNPILFVEGDKGSLDQQLYQSFYENLTIIPRGSCDKVCEAVKGFNENLSLHNNVAFGLIDRDYKTEEEITKLLTKKIFVTPTKQIENIFLLPEVIDIVSVHLGKVDKKDQVIDTIIAEFKTSLKDINFSIKKTRIFNYVLKEMGQVRDEATLSDFQVNFVQKISQFIQTIVPVEETNDILNILKIYPHKGLVSKIQSQLGVVMYQNLVLSLITSQKRTQMVEVLKRYLPKIQ